MRSANHAFFWSSGTSNSGIHREPGLRVDGHALHEVRRLLVVAAEPVRVRERGDALDAANSIAVALGQRLDDRDLVDHHEAIRAGHVHAQLNAARIAISPPNSTNATMIVRMVMKRSDLAAHQVAPDDVKELHTFSVSASVTSRPFSRCSVRFARSAACGIVRHHDDRLAVVAVQRLEQVENLVAGLAIEIARRLVAKQQRRIGDDRAGDADALLLAARELPRIVVGPLAEPDDRQRGLHALPAVCGSQLRQQQRELDVARRRQHRQQVVHLEDEPDVPRAPGRELAARERVDAIAGNLDRSLRRRVQPADQVEQRRLARARRPHQREKIARGDVDRHALEHVDLLAPAVVHLVQVPDLD